MCGSNLLPAWIVVQMAYVKGPRMDDPSSGSAPAYVKTDFICAQLGITPRTLKAMVQRGSFPAPAIHIGNRPRWELSQVRSSFPAIHGKAVAYDRT